MNIWIEFMSLLCGLALFSVVGAIRVGLPIPGFESAESAAPDGRRYSAGRRR